MEGAEVRSDNGSPRAETGAGESSTRWPLGKPILRGCPLLLLGLDTLDWTEEGQQDALVRLLTSEGLRRHPLPAAYVTQLLKTVMRTAERQGHALHEGLYECMGEAIGRPSDSAAFRHYQISPQQRLVCREEAAFVAQGTTGLRTWPAALYLAAWARTHKAPMEEALVEASQRPPIVLELGCGTGLLTIALAHLWPRARLIATDRSAEALRQCAYNCSLNGLSVNGEPVLQSNSCEQPDTERDAKGVNAHRNADRAQPNSSSDDSEDNEGTTCKGDDKGNASDNDDKEKNADGDSARGCTCGTHADAGMGASTRDLAPVRVEQLDWAQVAIETRQQRGDRGNGRAGKQDISRDGTSREGAHGRPACSWRVLCNADVLVGADIVFDPAVVPSLVTTLGTGLRGCRRCCGCKNKQRAVAYIASTVRNQETYAVFKRAIAEQGLEYSEVAVDAKDVEDLVDDRSCPIVLCRIAAPH